jgi:hypothetical protein
MERDAMDKLPALVRPSNPRSRLHVTRTAGVGFAGDDDDHRKPHTLSAT